ANASDGWAVGDNGTIIATTDGGTTWNVQNSGTTDELTAVAFANASDGWALGDVYDAAIGTYTGAIFATTNGGTTWSPQYSGTTEYLTAVAFANASDGWAVGFDSAGYSTILATTNGGTTWSPQSPGTTTQLYSVTCADATHAWALGPDPNGDSTIFATTNGGTTWSPQSTTTNLLLNGVTCADATHAWAVGGGGIIFATTNGGTTWSPQGTGTTDTLSGVTCTDATHAWAVGWGGTTLITTTGGIVIPPLSSLTVSAGTLSPAFSAGTQSYSDSVANSVASITVTPTTNDSQATYVLQVGGATVSNPIALSVGANVIDVVVTAQNGASETYVVTVTRAATIISKPTLTAFTPTSGLVGSSVTLTGTNFSGATAVNFNGHPAASFTVRSATQIITHVPSGATSGAIRVTTSGGTATSAARFTVLIKPTLTLKLSGLTSGAMKLGKLLTASGKVTPTNLSGKVTLTVQREQSGHWLAVTSLTRTISTSGAYSWAYKPTRRASYRIKTTIAKTTAHTAATTMWLTFVLK
ncbi:MAG: cadherin-like beta sandwich domain-containing protein, partial [Thermoleophilia bacterium]